MSSADPVDRHFGHVMDLERELLQPGVRRRTKRVLELLHPDFHEFGASGTIWTAETIAEHLASQPDTDDVSVEVQEQTAHALGPASILVTYALKVGDRRTLRSSVWVHYTSSWRLLFHQGTHDGREA